MIKTAAPARKPPRVPKRRSSKTRTETFKKYGNAKGRLMFIGPKASPAAARMSHATLGHPTGCRWHPPVEPRQGAGTYRSEGALGACACRVVPRKSCFSHAFRVVQAQTTVAQQFLQAGRRQQRRADSCPCRFLPRLLDCSGAQQPLARMCRVCRRLPMG